MEDHKNNKSGDQATPATSPAPTAQRPVAVVRPFNLQGCLNRSNLATVDRPIAVVAPFQLENASDSDPESPADQVYYPIPPTVEQTRRVFATFGLRYPGEEQAASVAQNAETEQNVGAAQKQDQSNNE